MVPGLYYLDAILIGAIGGYKWDNSEKHLKPETGLLSISAGLGVFANPWPATVLPRTTYVFGFRVPLFIDADQGTGGKWGLWILHKLALTRVFAVIIFMFHSSWRDRLPAFELSTKCRN